MGQLEDMAVFVRIVEAGGIGRAAGQLGLAKSAVSRRLVGLEGRLGAQLLTRTTRRSSLTEAGRAYYRRALAILADVAELNAQTSDSRALLQGTLKVAVPLSFGLQHLAPAICDFAVRHPRLVIQLDFADRRVDLVEEGVDLAVRIAALGDSSLVARALAPVRHVLCASPAYLAKRGRPERPPDLAGHAGLLYAQGASAAWRFTGPDGREAGLTPPVKMRADNGDFLCAAAVAGHGLALLPTFLVWQAVERGELVCVMTGYEGPTLTAYAVYPQTRHLSQRVRALIDFLAERFAGTPYWDAKL